MICEYSLFEFKSFHKSYLNYVPGAMNSIKLLLRRPAYCGIRSVRYSTECSRKGAMTQSK
jgi:hypothetical protein